MNYSTTKMVSSMTLPPAHRTLYTGSKFSSRIGEVLNHDAARLFPRCRKRDGIVELSSLFWLQVLETAREEEVHAVVVHLTILHVCQEA